MKEKKSHNEEIIEELKQRFEVDLAVARPTEDEVQFLRERDQLEEEVLWSFEKYVQNYDLLKAYGLEDKLINELEWFIVFKLVHNKEEFMESSFYKKFKDHKVVQRALSEHERKMELM